MVVDSTLTFAARRNVPVRYNRDHVATTLRAIPRIEEIRQRRERVFYKERMKGNKERERAANRKLVAENEHLLPKMRGSERLALEQKHLDGEEVEDEAPLRAEKSKVFGKQKLRRKLLVNDDVEEEMDLD